MTISTSLGQMQQTSGCRKFELAFMAAQDLCIKSNSLISYDLPRAAGLETYLCSEHTALAS